MNTAILFYFVDGTSKLNNYTDVKRFKSNKRNFLPTSDMFGFTSARFVEILADGPVT